MTMIGDYIEGWIMILRNNEHMYRKFRENSLQYWDQIHEDQHYNRDAIKVDDWLDRFEDIIDRSSFPILDLGCGGGNNTLYQINKGKSVIACDQSEKAVAMIQKNFPEIKT